MEDKIWVMWDVSDAKQEVVVLCEDEPTAAFIVAAVNAMKPMRAALELARATICRGIIVTHELGDEANPADNPVIKQIDAVLALAGKSHE